MKYNSIENTNSKKVLIKKFETRLLKEGKQTKARLILVNIFNHFKNLNENPFFIIEKAISNVKPFFIIKTVQKGKQHIIMPLPIINENKRISLAIKYLISNAKRHSENSLSLNLIKELKDASLNKGFTKQQQQEMHEIVLLNRKKIQLTTRNAPLVFK